MFEREWVVRLCTLLSAPGQFRTTLGWSFWTEQEEEKRDFFSPPHFRKTENDLSKAMVQGYVMDGFVLLCLSIFHSFLRCHSYYFFSLRKAIISITLHISAKFTVSVHAWPKGRKSHSVGVEFHFLARMYSFLWFVHGVGITMWYYFTGAHNIARRCSDCCYWNFDYN